jgi:outer membrane protein assembly factor BamB
MKRLSRYRVLFLASWALVSGAAVALADNWPSWRGPDANGISKETSLPAQWSETKNIVWRVPLPGMGGSTPVIWGDRLFLTSGDGQSLVLICIDTGAGKQVWKRKIGSGSKLFKKGEANQASASPSTDGKHVFAFVGTGDFSCFDFQGNQVWTFNAQDRYGQFSIQHGIHNTPVLHEDRLYMTLLHSNGHWVIALDKASGKEVWKVARKSDAQFECKEAYTTPCLWDHGNEKCLVVLGCDYATAHRLGDGGELWRLGGLNPKAGYQNAFRIISSPVAADGLLVVPTARQKQVVALKPGASGMIKPGSAFELWRNAKGAPDVPSPLIHDGLIYLCSEGGVLTCLEAKTGKQLYEKRLHTARYRASPVYADGKVILTSRDGVFSVVKAGPTFELLASNTLPDEFTASPAVANGTIYLRGFKTLYAVQAAK